ncbi:hypothetical protein RCJ22_04380, partial [Vibrio sp. FNV 38]|nr:hypothetical protein [Vibrio sp. FNV 38]
VSCETVKDPDRYEGQEFDLATEKKSEEVFEIQPLLIRVTDAAGNEQFRFLAWLWCAKGMMDLWENERVTPYPARVAARRGGAWLLSVGTEPEGNVSWLLYDKDAGTLSLLAVCEQMLTLGDCILLHAMDYSG